MAANPHSYPPGYLEANHSGRLVACVTVFLVFTTLLLALRLFARRLNEVKHGWDEALLSVAWVLLVCGCVTAYLAASIGGAGRHVVAVVMKNPETLVVRAKLTYSISGLSGLSTSFSRCAFIALYLRIFIHRWTRVASWVVLFYLVGLALAQIITRFVECRPFAKIWDSKLPGECINTFAYYRTFSILNILAEVGILALPVHTIWNLQTSTARKAGIGIIFLSSALGLFASCFRAWAFFGGAESSLEDPTWTDVSLLSWTLVESGMCLIAACLIGLRPLLTLISSSMKNYHITTSSSAPWISIKSTTDSRDGGESTSGIVHGAETEHVSLAHFEERKEQKRQGTKDITVDHEVFIVSTA